MFEQSVSYEAAYLAKFPSTDEDCPRRSEGPWNAVGAATQEPDDSRTGRLPQWTCDRAYGIGVG